MSSSRVKNFRRRSEDNDAKAEDKASPRPTAISTISSKSQALTAVKPKIPKPEGPKRLSFADEDEEDSPSITTIVRFAAKTPASGSTSIHKHTTSRDRSAINAPHIPSNVQPQSGEYTKEKLLELQKNARPLGGSMSKPQKSNPQAEPVIVLKGTVKPMPPTPSPNQTQEEEAEDDQVSFRKLALDVKPEVSSAIPDQATINAIRAKRERLRQSRGPAPDYISLDSGGVLGSRSSGGGSSDDEDNDFQSRIALFGEKNDGKVKKGVFEEIDVRVHAAEEKVVDDEDEEERRWEEEQFRKGLGKRFDEASTQVSANKVIQTPALQPALSIPLNTVAGVSLGSEAMSIPQQAAVASRALLDNIGKLKESHKRAVASLVRNDENLSEALSNITTLEKSLQQADEKYKFMQQLREFISVICDFLKDKASLIEELEEEMQKLHEQRAAVIEERRAADIADENGGLEAAISAARSVLDRGSSSAYIAAASAAVQASLAAVRESSNLPVQLDEYGRDINLQKRMDFARRADARKRRRIQVEAKRLSFVAKGVGESMQIEGEVSSDESDSESSAYQSSRNELLQTAEQVFSDAADEYSKLSVVKERLEKWKKHYLPSYRDSYMSLSVPSIFSPYVRLELLRWDPLYKTMDFFDMEWHKVLLDYGSIGGKIDFEPDDKDANLIPILVEKVALPILHHDIAHCWNLFSTQRTENAVFAMNLIISYVSPTSKALLELLEVVCSRLTEAVANISIPVWSATVMSVVPGTAQLAAYRFGTSIRLLKNICLWKDILALPVLEKLALQELLIGKLLPHVRSTMSNVHDAITRTERIVASLVGVWCGPNVTADYGQKLQPLVDCVSEIGRELERRHASGVSAKETLGLARRLKAMLVQLNQYDRARIMLKTFHLKEAL
ncbi:transcriptional repressor ILP1 [Phalaenopsis equestris]|uniref:transcriptional repressor ILP1 n=1 Tax=Phalaenopsis equestris TaxID=78828 RepID=UPI0009E3DDD5|nr:transcriptional repressor ILP1 [Phalaenopsis equestris]